MRGRPIMGIGWIVLGASPWLLGASAVTWTVTKPVDLTELTSELKTGVPALEGCDQDGTRITCRALTDPFTAEEQQTLETILTAHDAADARRKRDERNTPTEIPVESLGAGVAGALAALGGKQLVLLVQKQSKKEKQPEAPP